MSNAGSNGPVDPVPSRPVPDPDRGASRALPPRGTGRPPAGAQADSPPGAGPDPESPITLAAVRLLAYLTGRGGTVGDYPLARLAPLIEVHGEDRLRAVVDVAMADGWYRARPDRMRPEVIFGAVQLSMLLSKARAKVKVPAAVQTWAKAPRPPVGATCPGGTCAWCNEPQVFAWDGADWQADPAHQPCRDAARAWDRSRGVP
jgi:hypothetical protein